MEFAIALIPLIQVLVKAAIEGREPRPEDIAKSVAHLKQNQQDLDAMIKQIELDPALADLVAKRHKRDVVPSIPQDVPPIENV
jgi:hypothetical protein